MNVPPTTEFPPVKGKPPSTPFVATVVAIGIAGLLLLFVPFVFAISGPSLVMMICIGNIFGTLWGHATLAAMWVVFGRCSLGTRLGIAAGWLLFLLGALISGALIVNPVFSPVFFVLVSCCLFVQWLVVQLPLWSLARWDRWQMSFPGEAPGKRLQFGIRQIMVTTLVIAAVLGILRILLASRDGLGVAADAIAACSLITGLSMLMTVPLAIATFLPRRRWAAIGLALLSASIATAGEVPALNVLTPGAWSIIIVSMNATQCGWILFFGEIFWRAGYRLSNGEKTQGVQLATSPL